MVLTLMALDSAIFNLVFEQFDYIFEACVGLGSRVKPQNQPQPLRAVVVRSGLSTGR